MYIKVDSFSLPIGKKERRSSTFRPKHGKLIRRLLAVTLLSVGRLGSIYRPGILPMALITETESQGNVQ